MLSQAQAMLERQRSYESGRMAFLTLFDPHVSKPELLHEHRNLLLRRPRIIIICRPGTTLGQIRETFEDHGWSETTYHGWLDSNGRAFLPRGCDLKKADESLFINPRGDGPWSPTIQ